MSQIAQHLLDNRAEMLRVARARLRNRDWAEEAVSATMLAALERPPAFAEPARVRAWLFGTLRHKVVDQLRTGLAMPSSASTSLEGDEHDLIDREPCAQAGPERRAMDAEFMGTLQGLIDDLPGKQAQAFLLTECTCTSPADICRTLQVTEVHLGVLLHRARRRLRLGLKAHR